MNKPAMFFAGTTALFALSTLYLARQLHEPTAIAAADNPIAVGHSRPPVATATPSALQEPVALPKPDGAIQPGTASTAATTAVPGVAADSRREVLLPFARDFLRQYDDLAQRGMLLTNARAGFESQYSALRGRLKVDAATFDQLVSLLAEESLEQQASYFRCISDPACNLASVTTPRDRSDEFLALLGAEGYAQFTSYRGSLPEWQSVVQLRGRLSESDYLRDVDAERLRTTLTEARERYAEEARQQGANLQGWGNGAGMLWYSGDGTPQQQLASATQFSQNLRQRAATLLTAEQLRVFAQLQDELLASLGAYLQQAQANPGEPAQPRKAKQVAAAGV